MNGAIVAHTTRVAAELAARCSASEELAAWVRIAEQREAMVGQLYHPDAIAPRIPGEKTSNVARVVMKALGSIWAQEVTHTCLLGALRTVAEDDAPRTEAILGGLEGSLVGRATAEGLSGAMARGLIGLGRALGKAPDFTRDLSPLRFDAFCNFSRELEQTAAHGYARMLALISDLEAQQERPQFGLWQRYEIAKTLAEERLHAAVLNRIECWLAADKSHFLPRNAERCVEELRDLAAAHLSVRDLSELPRNAETGSARSVGDTGWVSDGGLGDLFRDFGVHVPLCDQALLALDSGGHERSREARR